MRCQHYNTKSSLALRIGTAQCSNINSTAVPFLALPIKLLPRDPIVRHCSASASSREIELRSPALLMWQTDCSALCHARLETQTASAFSLKENIVNYSCCFLCLPEIPTQIVSFCFVSLTISSFVLSPVILTRSVFCAA